MQSSWSYDICVTLLFSDIALLAMRKPFSCILEPIKENFFPLLTSYLYLAL